jgi:hypothetical protein
MLKNLKNPFPEFPLFLVYATDRKSVKAKALSFSESVPATNLNAIWYVIL